MMKDKILIAAAAAMIGFAPAAMAEDLITDKDLGGKFSANVGATTEYFYRGLTQSGKGNPAIQGGFDFNHNSGFYVGNWNSSINFGGNIESDFYAGYTWEIGKTGYKPNIGVLYYHYPSAKSSEKWDMIEGYIGLSKDFGVAAAMAKFSYSPDETGSGTKKDSQYLEAGVDIPAGKYFTVNLYGGRKWYADNRGAAVDDYFTWMLGVSTGVLGATLKAAWVDNDLPDSQSRDMGRFVVSLTKSF